jgi:hypothetical protein
MTTLKSTLKWSIGSIVVLAIAFSALWGWHKEQSLEDPCKYQVVYRVSSEKYGFEVGHVNSDCSIQIRNTAVITNPAFEGQMILLLAEADKCWDKRVKSESLGLRIAGASGSSKRK